ncbi:SET and MYND domain-containing protein 4-like [Onthophagus taurus]|uniref:SET and MYND domain-containing protein 4-like n=1 Tax=Onthophagus taurus TaxID=166361 RepID=UPI000C20D8C5|nr:SET and MYND domain-containing protein 4-like [Onthophagus taurus]
MTGEVFLSFRTHCEKLVQLLNHEQINNFKNGADDMDRIKQMYEHAIKIPIAEQSRGKSLQEAANFKTNANLFYKNKNLLEAIHQYNRGVVTCPIDTDESRKLLAVLVANRSAVLFELSLYKQCIVDVDWVLQTGWYPEDLQYKILLRKGKCCSEIKVYKKAVDSIKEAIKVGVNTKLSEQKLKEIRQILKIAQEKCAKSDQNSIDVKSEQITYVKFDRNNFYPAASESVDFRYDPNVGRYAIATKDIPAATIILEEEPFSIVVGKDNILKNCSHCGLNTLSPYPCENCTHVIFCSNSCKEKANYHQIECNILPTIYTSGASVNCLLSLRIITQQGLAFLWENRKCFGKKHEDGSIYKSNDYARLYQLCTHTEIRPKGEFLHYTFMAIFLLRLLKKTSFFPFETQEEVLKDEEAYIGSLLLRHLQLLQFNAHEISEMRNTDGKCDVSYRNSHVGGGIYPTLALFNHSCEPSIIRYNKGTKMIARTVKYIKAGDAIFENYGPIYCTHKYVDRQRKMKERYYFDCQCVPCVENWPLYEQMDEQSLRLKCQTCEHCLIVGVDQDNPFVVCKKCKTKNNIMLPSLQLMKLDEFTTKAEDLFKQGDYEGAIVFYQTAMEFYHKHMVAPFKDMVKVQQRLRTCMVHDGNTQVLYKKPTEFLPVNADQNSEEILNTQPQMV